MRLGTTELLLLLALALLLFGGSKLAGLGKSMGQSIREFKEELKTKEGDDKIADSGKESGNETNG